MKRLPVKFRMPKSVRTWAQGSTWRELILTILATTISIVLTFGTAALLERCQRIEDRKLSAMMVMSNIESFSREVEKKADEMARLDSIATWLLSLPKDSLDNIPADEMRDIINEVVALDFLTHDKTAESIFSNSIETWKNLGNFQFIDNVGDCFSRMNADLSYWNDWVEDFEKVVYNVLDHPEDYPGERTTTKLLNNEVFRSKIESFHVRKEYMKYSADYYRYLNEKNMALINISKDELMAFTDERTRNIKTEMSEPVQANYRQEQLSADSLTTLRPIIQHIDSIIHKKIPPK